MTVKEILIELEKMGNPGTKKILMKHGAKEPFFGVKVQDLKKIVKKVKKNNELALELFDTGNSDAMYLAGLIADENKMTKTQLRKWAKNAYWYMISEYSVAWVTSESKHGWDLALEWIDKKDERLASAGWATLSSIVGTYSDDDLDLKAISKLLDRVKKEIHDSQNRVRYTMNGFVIAVGSYITELNPKASKIAEAIGKVEVSMGETSCKVPLAKDYIQKIVDKGRLGKKRKMARC